MPGFLPPVVVFDAYGTLVENPLSAQPFRRLREVLEKAGVDTSEYPSRAMTSRHSLTSLAQSYGEVVPQEVLAKFEQDLLGELFAVRPFPDAQRTIRHVLSQGATVVIASNLAWPYALPVKHIVRGIMGDLEMRLDAGRVRTAFSFDIGHLKPSSHFFITLAGSVGGMENHDFFMVGDRYTEDVEGPESIGWKAWLLDRESGSGLLDAPWDDWLP